MRRLPVYFVLDVSESMVGEPIQQVQEGMRMIINGLRSDPYSLETVFVSIIAFAGKAHVISPLEELYKFRLPELPVGDGTSISEALNCLMSDMDHSIKKTSMEEKGDWKPIIFLFTDGVPTDDPSNTIEKWNSYYRNHCNLIAVSIGDGVDTYLLGQITDNVLRLKDTDKDTFKTFFKWVTASIKTSSMSVSTYSSEVELAPIDNISLEKVETYKPLKIDDNYAVFHGKCSNTGKSYLIKYGRIAKDSNTFKLIGAYTVNSESYEKFSGSNPDRKNISTDNLIGDPACPCCENTSSLILCDCENISCGETGKPHKCPWCGNQGEIVDTETLDLPRERG